MAFGTGKGAADFLEAGFNSPVEFQNYQPLNAVSTGKLPSVPCVGVTLVEVCVAFSSTVEVLLCLILQKCLHHTWNMCCDLFVFFLSFVDSFGSRAVSICDITCEAERKIG